MRILPIGFTNTLKTNNLNKNTRNYFLRNNAVDTVSFQKKDKKITVEQAQEQFEKIGITTKLLEDGTLELRSYEPGKHQIQNLEIDENELFKHVTSIEYYATFERSNLTSTHALKKVGKSVDFAFSKIKETPNLTYVGKDVRYSISEIKDTGKIYIGRDVDFKDSQIEDKTKVVYGREKYE